MPRQKGTLMNFVGDGEISQADANKVLRSGKIAIGQERVMILDRAQLIKWGILEGD